MTPWQKIEVFEQTLAEFFGAPYAVSVDSCTHGIELCLRLKDVKSTKCPIHTYISIPFTLMKLKIDWSWDENYWHRFYKLDNTDIIDAATMWQRQSYMFGTLTCISFQNKKHLSLGRGGLILVDNYSDWADLKKMSYDGRFGEEPWKDQNINTVGYHYYMTPETAELGLEKFEQVKDLESRVWSYKDYPYLPNFEVFKKC